MGSLLRKRMIGIVDDDESVREALDALVRSLGYETLTFVNAEEFLRSPGIADIGCLIADLQMPGLNGIELRCRLVTLGKPIPTILITAHPDERTRRLAFGAGIVCYLAKPFNDDELIECLQKATAA
jgi:FixJ family two-component response regulator